MERHDVERASADDGRHHRFAGRQLPSRLRAAGARPVAGAGRLRRRPDRGQPVRRRDVEFGRPRREPGGRRPAGAAARGHFVPSASAPGSVRSHDPLALAGILCVAAFLRIAPSWDDVLRDGRVNFVETDAWYHVRLIENQVHNFPHRVTVDPYASPDGRYEAVAPLFDTLVSTFVFLTRGASASTLYIERVAAFAPPAIGVVAIATIWVLGTIAFGRREGLLAAL